MPDIILVFDVDVFFLHRASYLSVVMVWMVIPSSSRLSKHLRNHSFSMALDDVASVTCTSLKMATLHVSLSIKV